MKCMIYPCAYCTYISQEVITALLKSYQGQDTKAYDACWYANKGENTTILITSKVSATLFL